MCTKLRPMLFLETASLGDSQATSTVPVLPLVHHVIGRSPLRLPHQIHGWQEAEYVRWVNEHDENDRLQLVRKVVYDHDDVSDPDTQQYVDILKRILDRKSSIAGL